MLRNMACSLLTHEAIRTTLPKAKELRRVVEPLITLAKEPTVANKRLAFNRLRDRDVVVKLFNEVAPRSATATTLRWPTWNSPNAPCRSRKLLLRLPPLPPPLKTSRLNNCLAAHPA